MSIISSCQYMGTPIPHPSKRQVPLPHHVTVGNKPDLGQNFGLDCRPEKPGHHRSGRRSDTRHHNLLRNWRMFCRRRPREPLPIHNRRLDGRSSMECRRPSEYSRMALSRVSRSSSRRVAPSGPVTAVAPLADMHSFRLTVPPVELRCGFTRRRGVGSSSHHIQGMQPEK